MPKGAIIESDFQVWPRRSAKGLSADGIPTPGPGVPGWEERSVTAGQSGRLGAGDHYLKGQQIAEEWIGCSQDLRPLYERLRVLLE
jgi:hypothetical protein